MTSSLEFSFTYAQQHPESRQEFIDSIDLEEAKTYINKVVYRGNHDLSYIFLKKLNPLMRIGLSPFYRLWKEQRSSIIVYPEAFSSELIHNKGDFLSLLIDHEGTHAKDSFKDPWSMLIGMTEIESRVAEDSWRRLYNKVDAKEQRAIYHQIQNFDRRGCSQQFRETILAKHQQYKEFLSHRENLSYRELG